MQNRKNLGTICLGTLAVLATTLTISLPANAADSVRSTSTTFKRTSRPTTKMTRTSSTKPMYKKTTRRTSPSTSSVRVKSIRAMKMGNVLDNNDIAEADSDMTSSSNEMSKEEMRRYIRYLMARVSRLERLTGYTRRTSSRRSRNSRAQRRSLNARVTDLETTLGPVIAQQRRIKRSRAASKARGERNKKMVRDATNNVRRGTQEAARNVGTGVSNAAKSGRKAAEKARDGISQGINSGINQAQDTFNNMMPGSN